MTNTRMAAIGRGAKGCRIAFIAVVAAAALALGAGPAAASTPPVYNSIPTVLPGNVPSVGFEATSTSEFGDYIALAGTERASENVPVTIVMSIWACETGGWTGTDCATTPGDTWAQPLTLTIYNVDHTSPTVPAAGTVVLTTTQTFNLPFRPSYDPTNCPANGNSHRWWSVSDSTCYNGLAHYVTFTLPGGHTLPDELIWGISYNTRDYGPSPIGGPSGPYDSLNVGAETFAGMPSDGTDVEPDGAFLNSTWSGAYGDGGAGGMGKFRDDTGWSDLKPLACFGAACPLGTPVAAPSPTGSEAVGGVTFAPRSATPPPTATGDTSGRSPGSTFALLICVAFGGAALVAVGAQRRMLRR